MDIDILNNNINNYHCSYCGSPSHDIRFCSSPAISNIEHTIAQVYYSNFRQSALLNLSEEATEESFVNNLTQRFLLRDIRVVAVANARAAASGINKRQYAVILYTVYKTAYNFIINQYNLINNYVRDLIGDFEAVATGPQKFNITPILNIIDESIEAKEDVCECAICLVDTVKLKDSVKLNCSHQFCGECVIKTLETHKSASLNPRCALCRITISNVTVNNNDNYNKVSQFCFM